jgi:hypothetical protein
MAIRKGRSSAQALSFVEIGANAEVYEYSVLATSLDEELASFGQLYRDRGDSENIFDELKNQWGWGGFVTQDLARRRLAAHMIALFYDWWSIFVRLVEPDRHMEAITGRHRHAGAACETNNNHRSEFTREGGSGREGVSLCRHFSTRTRKKCGAVDGPATLAANPRKSLPSFPSRPSVALAPAPRARLTQLSVEKTQKSVANPTPTAGFRLISLSFRRLPFGSYSHFLFLAIDGRQLLWFVSTVGKL